VYIEVRERNAEKVKDLGLRDKKEDCETATQCKHNL